MPATIAPCASSDMPVTISAPGSSTAIGASAVRSGPSSRPSSAARNTTQPAPNAAATGSNVRSRCERSASRSSAVTTNAATIAVSTLAPVGWITSATPAACGTCASATTGRETRGGLARAAWTAASASSGAIRLASSAAVSSSTSAA